LLSPKHPRHVAHLTSVAHRMSLNLSDNLQKVSRSRYPEDRAPTSLMVCQPWGRRMYDNVCLAGQVILIVEDDGGPFAEQLRAALDWTGARTLLARTLAHARDHVACFDLTAAAIYSDGAIHSVDFPQLVKEMGGMPLLLYGAEPPPHQPFKNARFLAASKPSHTGAIVEAVTRLLSSSAPALARLSTL
jgi:hypothetical protein